MTTAQMNSQMIDTTIQSAKQSIGQHGAAVLAFADQALSQYPEFAQWLNEAGGPALLAVDSTAQLVSALSTLERLPVPVALIELGRGMVAGRAYYSQLGRDRARLGLLSDASRADVLLVADVMREFDHVAVQDETFADSLAQHMATDDIDVLNVLYDQALKVSVFAQGMIMSWMGAHAPWTTDKKLCQQ